MKSLALDIDSYCYNYTYCAQFTTRYYECSKFRRLLQLSKRMNSRFNNDCTNLPGKGFVLILTVEGRIHLLLDTICTHSKQNKHFYREDVKKEKLKACELRPFNYFMYRIQFQATHSHALQKKILFLTNCCSLHVSE